MEAKKRKPYKAKSIEGAQRKVRSLQRDIEQWRALVGDLERYLVREQHTSRLLARMAAEGPAFDNPLVAMEAKNRRDQKLAELGMKPDGTVLAPPGATSL